MFEPKGLSAAIKLMLRGSVMEVIFVPANTLAEIVVIETLPVAKVACASSLHPSNALLLISANVEGSETEVISLQFLNALDPIDVTPSGMTSAPASLVP